MNLPAASPNSLTGRSKKVFITGGTGFIGSHLLKQFSGTELKFGALPYREGEIMESAADIGALERLGWRPNFSLEQGLAHAIEAENDQMSDASTTA